MSGSYDRWHFEIGLVAAKHPPVAAGSQVPRAIRRPHQGIWYINPNPMQTHRPMYQRYIGKLPGSESQNGPTQNNAIGRSRRAPPPKQYQAPRPQEQGWSGKQNIS